MEATETVQSPSTNIFKLAMASGQSSAEMFESIIRNNDKDIKYAARQGFLKGILDKMGDPIAQSVVCAGYIEAVEKVCEQLGGES